MAERDLHYSTKVYFIYNKEHSNEIGEMAKKKNSRENDTTKWQRALLGILMALIMIGSVVAMMLQL